MKKEEAKKLPRMDIVPTPLIEDWFYYLMYRIGRISPKAGYKALKRLDIEMDYAQFYGAALVAEVMIDNLNEYGAPCADWCED